MQTWMRFGIGVAAIALAIAAGTAAYAMRDSSDEPDRETTNAVPPAPETGEDTGSNGGAIAAICAADQPDCEDTVDVPLGDFDTSRCLPEAVECVDMYTCVTTLPAPIDDPALVDPAFSEPLPDEEAIVGTDAGPGDEPAAPSELTPEEQARLEDQRAREIALCTQTEPCVPGPAVDCGPIDKCVPGPAVDCGPVDCVVGPADECLPPDCAISSDGTVSCPAAEPCILPAPDLPAETIIERCGVGCSSPGFDPDAPQADPATDPAIGAPEGTLPCPVDPPIGGGTDGSQPGSPGVVEPAPAE